VAQGSFQSDFHPEVNRETHEIRERKPFQINVEAQKMQGRKVGALPLGGSSDALCAAAA
jgi:hypothetical protein